MIRRNEEPWKGSRLHGRKKRLEWLGLVGWILVILLFSVGMTFVVKIVLPNSEVEQTQIEGIRAIVEQLGSLDTTLRETNQIMRQCGCEGESDGTNNRYGAD